MQLFVFLLSLCDRLQASDHVILISMPIGPHMHYTSFCIQLHHRKKLYNFLHEIKYTLYKSKLYFDKIHKAVSYRFCKSYQLHSKLKPSWSLTKGFRLQHLKRTKPLLGKREKERKSGLIKTYETCHTVLQVIIKNPA